MNDFTSEVARASINAPQSKTRGLFRKYAALVVTVVCVALLANSLFGIWLSYQDHKASFVRLQREQAALAAVKIGNFIKEIEGQLGWTTQWQGAEATLEERRLDALRLLRQVSAVTEFAWIDEAGRERLRISRMDPDVIGSEKDLSHETAFIEGIARKVYYGPVYFRRGSEPYLTLALGGSRRDAGVSVADVNLVYVWDVVSQIKVGEKGRAYVVDATGRLIAHPDISLVLRNTDFSRLAQVQIARGVNQDPAAQQAQIADDVTGRQVLTAHATVAPLDWLVFVELPLDEAYAPVYASIFATGLVLLGGFVLAVLASLLLARRMVTPIRALQAGAAQIGSGALDHRIDIKTDDELEALGDQFNSMAAQLQDSYATLERRVEERTHQLQLANLAKSRFLAAASHDLRQPLHALNLFVTQLRKEKDQTEKALVIDRIDAAVVAMNELFNALLDISKLDAGVLAPVIVDLPVEQLLKRIETTFVAAAREKGLRLRVVSSSAWIRSDFILLERVLLNLVSNAVRYTVRGGIVVGCRHRAGRLHIEVWDSGIGIPEDQQRNIFGEFFQLAAAEQDRRSGLGLGLAIVDRLCRLLAHPVELTSRLGRGSRFSVSTPLASPPTLAPHSPTAPADQAMGRLIIVIDDDALVLDAMRGILKTWGCSVVAAKSETAALAALAEHKRQPDLIISDYRLGDGKTGFEVIDQLRNALGARIPAFLISGDTAPERLREATASGYYLLHKPVLPITLRSTVSQLLRAHDDARRGNGVAPIRERVIAGQPAASSTRAPLPL
jgi:signal transduction histidine kinase/CheY-like chemotaxis protein